MHKTAAPTSSAKKRAARRAQIIDSRLANLASQQNAIRQNILKSWKQPEHLMLLEAVLPAKDAAIVLREVEPTSSSINSFAGFYQRYVERYMKQLTTHRTQILKDQARAH